MLAARRRFEQVQAWQAQTNVLPWSSSQVALCQEQAGRRRGTESFPYPALLQLLQAVGV